MVRYSLAKRCLDRKYWASLLAEQEPNSNRLLMTAVADTYIAIEHMILTGTALGLGTCWVGAMDSEREIAALYAFPDTTIAIAVLPVGYPVMIPPPRPRVSLSDILLRPL